MMFLFCRWSRSLRYTIFMAYSYTIQPILYHNTSLVAFPSLFWCCPPRRGGSIWNWNQACRPLRTISTESPTNLLISLSGMRSRLDTSSKVARQSLRSLTFLYVHHFVVPHSRNGASNRLALALEKGLLLFPLDLYAGGTK